MLNSIHQNICTFNDIVCINDNQYYDTAFRILQRLFEIYHHPDIAFKILDFNNDGYIEFQDFYDILKIKNICDDIDLVKKIFFILDLDLDGRLSHSNWYEGFNNIKNKINEGKIGNQLKHSYLYLNSSHSGIKYEQQISENKIVPRNFDYNTNQEFMNTHMQTNKELRPITSLKTRILSSSTIEGNSKNILLNLLADEIYTQDITQDKSINNTKDSAESESNLTQSENDSVSKRKKFDCVNSKKTPKTIEGKKIPGCTYPTMKKNSTSDIMNNNHSSSSNENFDFKKVEDIYSSNQIVKNINQSNIQSEGHMDKIYPDECLNKGKSDKESNIDNELEGNKDDEIAKKSMDIVDKSVKQKLANSFVVKSFDEFESLDDISILQNNNEESYNNNKNAQLKKYLDKRPSLVESDFDSVDSSNVELVNQSLGSKEHIITNGIKTVNSQGENAKSPYASTENSKDSPNSKFLGSAAKTDEMYEDIENAHTQNVMFQTIKSNNKLLSIEDLILNNNIQTNETISRITNQEEHQVVELTIEKNIQNKDISIKQQTTSLAKASPDNLNDQNLIFNNHEEISQKMETNFNQEEKYPSEPIESFEAFQNFFKEVPEIHGAGDGYKYNMQIITERSDEDKNSSLKRHSSYNDSHLCNSNVYMEIENNDNEGIKHDSIILKKEDFGCVFQEFETKNKSNDTDERSPSKIKRKFLEDDFLSFYSQSSPNEDKSQNNLILNIKNHLNKYGFSQEDTENLDELIKQTIHTASLPENADIKMEILKEPQLLIEHQKSTLTNKYLDKIQKIANKDPEKSNYEIKNLNENSASAKDFNQELSMADSMTKKLPDSLLITNNPSENHNFTRSINNNNKLNLSSSPDSITREKPFLSQGVFIKFESPKESRVISDENLRISYKILRSQNVENDDDHNEQDINHNIPNHSHQNSLTISGGLIIDHINIKDKAKIDFNGISDELESAKKVVSLKVSRSESLEQDNNIESINKKLNYNDLLNDENYINCIKENLKFEDNQDELLVNKEYNEEIIGNLVISEQNNVHNGKKDQVDVNSELIYKDTYGKGNMESMNNNELLSKFFQVEMNQNQEKIKQNEEDDDQHQNVLDLPNRKDSQKYGEYEKSYNNNPNQFFENNEVIDIKMEDFERVVVDNQTKDVDEIKNDRISIKNNENCFDLKHLLINNQNKKTQEFFSARNEKPVSNRYKDTIYDDNCKSQESIFSKNAQNESYSYETDLLKHKKVDYYNKTQGDNHENQRHEENQNDHDSNSIKTNAKKSPLDIQEQIFFSGCLKTKLKDNENDNFRVKNQEYMNDENKFSSSYAGPDHKNEMENFHPEEHTSIDCKFNNDKQIELTGFVDMMKNHQLVLFEKNIKIQSESESSPSIIAGISQKVTQDEDILNAPLTKNQELRISYNFKDAQQVQFNSIQHNNPENTQFEYFGRIQSSGDFENYEQRREHYQKFLEKPKIESSTENTTNIIEPSEYDKLKTNIIESERVTISRSCNSKIENMLYEPGLKKSLDSECNKSYEHSSTFSNEGLNQEDTNIMNINHKVYSNKAMVNPIAKNSNMQHIDNSNFKSKQLGDLSNIHDKEAEIIRENNFKTIGLRGHNTNDNLAKNLNSFMNISPNKTNANMQKKTFLWKSAVKYSSKDHISPSAKITKSESKYSNNMRINEDFKNSGNFNPSSMIFKYNKVYKKPTREYFMSLDSSQKNLERDTKIKSQSPIRKFTSPCQNRRCNTNLVIKVEQASIKKQKAITKSTQCILKQFEPVDDQNIPIKLICIRKETLRNKIPYKHGHINSLSRSNIKENIQPLKQSPMKHITMNIGEKYLTLHAKSKKYRQAETKKESYSLWNTTQDRNFNEQQDYLKTCMADSTQSYQHQLNLDLEVDLAEQTPQNFQKNYNDENDINEIFLSKSNSTFKYLETIDEKPIDVENEILSIHDDNLEEENQETNKTKDTMANNPKDNTYEESPIFDKKSNNELNPDKKNRVSVTSNFISNDTYECLKENEINQSGYASKTDSGFKKNADINENCFENSFYKLYQRIDEQVTMIGKEYHNDFSSTQAYDNILFKSPKVNNSTCDYGKTKSTFNSMCELYNDLSQRSSSSKNDSIRRSFKDNRSVNDPKNFYEIDRNIKNNQKKVLCSDNLESSERLKTINETLKETQDHDAIYSENDRKDTLSNISQFEIENLKMPKINDINDKIACYMGKKSKIAKNLDVEYYNESTIPEKNPKMNLLANNAKQKSIKKHDNIQEIQNTHKIHGKSPNFKNENTLNNYSNNPINHNLPISRTSSAKENKNKKQNSEAKGSYKSYLKDKLSKLDMLNKNIEHSIKEYTKK